MAVMFKRGISLMENLKFRKEEYLVRDISGPC